MNKTILPLFALMAACALGSSAGLPATAAPGTATQTPPAAQKARAVQPSPVPLAFPQELSASLVLTNGPQVFTFYGTNLTDREVKIIGYGSSCGCTTVESKSDVVPAKGEVEFRAKLTKTKPAIEYAIILDDQTNMYQVVFKVTPAEKN